MLGGLGLTVLQWNEVNLGCVCTCVQSACHHNRGLFPEVGPAVLGMSFVAQEGKRSIEGPTLFYMIHCGKALYNNLLWSNWSAEALSQMVVVGNSFRGFEERYATPPATWAGRVLESAAQPASSARPFQALAEFVQSWPVEPNSVDSHSAKV